MDEDLAEMLILARRESAKQRSLHNVQTAAGMEYVIDMLDGILKRRAAELLKRAEVASMHGVSTRTVERWEEAGHLQAVERGRYRRADALAARPRRRGRRKAAPPVDGAEQARRRDAPVTTAQKCKIR